MHSKVRPGPAPCVPFRRWVSTYPEDGTQIARVLRDDDDDLRASIINGWDSATLTDSLVHQVLAIISGWDHDEVRRPTASMLSNGGDPEHPTEWHQFEPARRLASNLWPTSMVEGAIVSGADIVMEAINHPAGDLAQFWTKVVRWEWTQNESTWAGLPESVTTELDRMISAPDRNGLLARTFFASQLHFFFGADRDWCEARLLPLFDWGERRGGRGSVAGLSHLGVDGTKACSKRDCSTVTRRPQHAPTNCPTAFAVNSQSI